MVETTVNQTLGPLSQTLFPAFARIKDDLPRLRNAYLRSLSVLCTLAFPAASGLAALAEPLVYLLLGEKWLPAVPIIQVLAAAGALLALNNSRPVAMATGHTKALFGRDLRSVAVRLPLFVGGILIGLATPLGVLMGAVSGRVLALIADLIMNMGLVRRIAGLRYRDQFLVCIRPATASAIMVSVLIVLTPASESFEGAPLDFLKLIGLVGAGSVVYAGALLLLWLIQGRPDGPEAEFIGLIQVAIKSARHRIAHMRSS